MQNNASAPSTYTIGLLKKEKIGPAYGFFCRVSWSVDTFDPVTGVGAAGGAEGGAVGLVGAVGPVGGVGEDIFYTGRRMKVYHMYFFFLKFLLVIQTALIIFQVENPNQISYIVSDIVFKLSLGIFLMVFFTFSTIPGMDIYDKFIASFAGALLSFDAFYINLPILLTKLGYKLPNWVVVRTAASHQKTP